MRIRAAYRKSHVAKFIRSIKNLNFLCLAPHLSPRTRWYFIDSTAFSVVSTLHFPTRKFDVQNVGMAKLFVR